LILSHKRTYFQFVGKYQGSNLALARRRGAVGDKTPSQAMTMLSTKSSSSGEPCKLSKTHEVQQLPLCRRLPCQSTRSHIISTSTDIQQLVLYLHLHRLSNRKCKANKFTGVQHYALRLHPPPLPNRPSKVMASASPICGLVKTRTMMGLLCLHPQALVTFLLSSWLIRASLLTPLAVIANPPLHLTTSRRM
jgi:hypothetical protein